MSQNLVHELPYQAGAPVPPGAPLFGRTALLRQLAAELRGAPGVLVLSGERLVGKTSLLLHLRDALPADAFLPARLDLGAVEAPERALLDAVVALGQAAGLSAAELGGAPGREEELIARILARVPPERRPVLLLDHVDQLDQRLQAAPAGWQDRLEQDEAGGVVLDLSDEVDEAPAPGGDLGAGLRRLLTAAPRLSLVLVVGPPEGRFSPGLAALIGEARRFWVPTLDESAARALVLSGRQVGVLDFKEEAIEHVLALCGGHPYFLQLVCQLLCESAYAGDSPIIHKVDAATVDQLVPQVLQAGQAGLSWIWSGLWPQEQRVLATLGRGLGERAGTPALDRLDEALRAEGPALPREDLRRLVESLTQRGLLRAREDGPAPSVELLRRWLGRPAPRREAGAGSLGERLFHVGRELMERRDLDGAEAVLRQALRVEATHLPARHLLGEALLAAARPQEAIAVLEEGDCSSPEAHALLCRALVERGAALERAGDEEGALGAYARAQSVQPADPRAHALLAALWRRRGDEAFARDELDGAEAAYREAGLEEGVAAVAARRRTLAIEQAAAQAERHAAREEWTEAAERYRWLAAEEPAEPRWHDALGRAEGEHALAELYREGAAALERGERIAAMKALGGVVHQRPGYKDAAVLLARACPAPPAPAAPLLPSPDVAPPLLSPDAPPLVAPLLAPPRAAPPAPKASRLGVSLGLGVGLLAVGLWAATARSYLRRPPPPPPVAERAPARAAEDPNALAAQHLLLAAAELEEQRWDEARARAAVVLGSPALGATPRRVAAALQARAAAELAARAEYDAFLAASEADDDAVTLERYQQIPPASVYRARAREDYEAVAARFTKERLAKAEAVRALGKCGDYQRRLAEILVLAPGQPAVKEAQLRPCGAKRAPAFPKKEPRGDEAP